MEMIVEVKKAKGELKWLLRTVLGFSLIELTSKTLSIIITTTEQSWFAHT